MLSPEIARPATIRKETSADGVTTAHVGHEGHRYGFWRHFADDRLDAPPRPRMENLFRDGGRDARSRDPVYGLADVGEGN